MGIPLRKYDALYKAAWKLADTTPEVGLSLRIAPDQFRAPINPTLRDLIRQRVNAIEDRTISDIGKTTIEYAARKIEAAAKDPEKFVESVQVHFAEGVGTHIVQPLLSMLDAPFREAAYSAIESIYEIEADLADNIAARTLDSLPPAVNTLIVSGDTTPMRDLFADSFSPQDVRLRVQSFFVDFATSDAFQELRDLQNSLRSAENQSIYLYFCDLKFGHTLFPLFYIPATLTYEEGTKAFVLDFDPHLFVNKQAVDWILQEHKGEATSLPISPVADRIVYLDDKRAFLEEMETVFSRLIPAFEFAAGIDLRTKTLQQVSSPTLKITTAAYLAVFDKSDESLINDYEELLAAFNEEQKSAGDLFENIIKGFLFDNPVSVSSAVDSAWDEMTIPDRLVAVSPIPVNEEQRKILMALKDPNCNYVSVQGPPGTGKSHTITAIAFEGILNGQSVLILSDKTEALDVVQDKLESALSKVRHGDEDFPNAILRLGRSGGTYNRLVSAAAQAKIKCHHKAAISHEDDLRKQYEETSATLRADIGKTVETLSSIRLDHLNELHALEAEFDTVRPDIITSLQRPSEPVRIPVLAPMAGAADLPSVPKVLARVLRDGGSNTLESLVPHLSAWERVGQLAGDVGPREPLTVFSTLESRHHETLLRYIARYESLRMPIIGWLFRRAAVRETDLKAGSELPCPDPIDLHKRLSHLKQAARVLGLLRDTFSREGLPEHLVGFAYRLLREGKAAHVDVPALASLAREFSSVVAGSPLNADALLRSADFRTPEELFAFIAKAVRYSALWADIAGRMGSVPKTDYVGTKTRLEQLNTTRMTREIDSRFLEFVDQKKATVKEIGGVIKHKQKFPEDEFHHLSDAFPIIIAGIREYAEYVPLKQRLFDLVVIDEASQVSVAQALPAVLRAKKIVVFGDAKQFSNVKSSQASIAINAGYLTDIEAYFRDNVADATTKIQRLKHFDVKKSILEFFDLIANYQTMLRKHFRGYQELISFSSKTFYDGQLQAIKIRSKPIQEVLRFEVLDSVPESPVKNVNRAEADFILKELRRMVDEGEEMSVGVITPFREQVKLLNEILFRDAYGEKFESELRLKIMTFDTCQGEERDLIIFSMVATATRDLLNYVFPVALDGETQDSDRLKVQRLNVGFSRGKEAFLFVLSKPADQFRGSIAVVLNHYKNILEDRSRADKLGVDPSSPMEIKVLDWIYKTPFCQVNEERIEVVPQFPVGEYLRQLDPFYSHPAYCCDFLVRYYDGQTTANVIIEYDGFAEHFVERKKIHNGNWELYYRPEDIERQMVIESYGYKFLRLNRFNTGKDPVDYMSKRLYELVEVASRADEDSSPVAQIKDDAEGIENGSKRCCPKCGEIRNIQEFWDPKLKSGSGGYGRNCLACKQAALKTRSGGRAKSWRSRFRYR